MKDITNILPMDEPPGEEGRDGYRGSMPEGNGYATDVPDAEAAFASDAEEGLQNFSSPEKVDGYVNQLNKKLRLQLGKKKLRKEKHEIKHLGWIIFTVVLILMLCVLGWVVVHMLESSPRP